MTTCPCGRADGARHGFATVTWRDLVDGRGAEVEAKVLRMKCACGRVWADAPVDLYGSYRMTPKLVAAVYAHALERPFREVAADFGLPEATIRFLFSKEAEAAIAEPRTSPDAPVIRVSDSGSATFVLLADGDDPRIVDAFEGFSDPRLRAFVEKSDAQLHADWRSGPYAASVSRCPERVTIHRSSASAKVRASLPDCARMLVAWLEGDDRSVVSEAVPLTGMAPLHLSMKENATLLDAARRVPALATFLKLAEDLLACFDARSAEEGKTRYLEWRGKLTGMFLDVFRPAFGYVDKQTTLIFNEGYAAIPTRVWRRIEAINIVRQPRESARKTIARTLAGLPLGPPLSAAPSPSPQATPY